MYQVLHEFIKPLTWTIIETTSYKDRFPHLVSRRLIHSRKPFKHVFSYEALIFDAWHLLNKRNYVHCFYPVSRKYRNRPPGYCTTLAVIWSCLFCYYTRERLANLVYKVACGRKNSRISTNPQLVTSTDPKGHQPDLREMWHQVVQPWKSRITCGHVLCCFWTRNNRWRLYLNDKSDDRLRS